MNLTRLVGLKNIRPKGNEPWAYEHRKEYHPAFNLFELHWRNPEGKHWDNAAALECSDLLLLKQSGLITHVAEIFDGEPRLNGEGEWNLTRIAKVLWAIDFDNPPAAAKVQNLIGASGMVQGGKVFPLQNLLSDRWPGDTGLKDFKAHLTTELGLV